MNDSLQLEDAAVEALMGQVVDDFLERQDRGERPEPEEYARRYPQLADVLRQLLPTLGLLRGSAVDDHAGAPDSAAEFTPEGPLGDYRLVREIGRGGMGVVYEAVQISLGRRVALKILPFAAALDARQLQRFKNEAHAAAQLHHQNIVPVYGVGCERGVHYFAMQFIDGQTLAAMIAELRRLDRPGAEAEGEAPPESLAGDLLSGKWLAHPPVPPLTKGGNGGGELAPTGPYVPSADSDAFQGVEKNGGSNGARRAERAAPETVRQLDAALSTESSTKNPAFFRSVAQLGIQAAQALEHSHSLGVIHRDIKPTNLLVDARGNLWVTDFGLAHIHNDTKLTLTGDILGTLRYMSPEQALAQRVDVDHRTDLYSLGATLYELLTLEPAFAGTDRRELLRQIAFEEPRRPRQVNKAIPLELETIVQKAMEKNPADRYARAQDLADDLERFLKDEPIRAQRPSLLQRVRKWARRHRPMVASATVATVVVLAIAIGALLISLGNISAALKEKSGALAEKSAALEGEQRAKEDLERTSYFRSMALAERHLSRGNVGGAEELLNECPPKLRGWEWHFLKRQRYGKAAPLQHPETPFNVAFSPDGRQIASDCLDGMVRVWDAETGTERDVFPGERALARGLAWSPDGRYLAVARLNGVVSIWNAVSEKAFALQAHPKMAWHVAFSPDSRTLASAGSDGKVRLWNVAGVQGTPADRPIHTLAEHPAEIWAVAFSADGRHLLSACDDGTVKTWNVATGQETFSFRAQFEYGWRPSFSPDARRLAWACLDGVVKVWDTATGREEFAVQTNTYWSRAVAFSADRRRIAVAGFDGTLRLLDSATGQETLTIYAHTSPVGGVAFSPDPDGSRLASASYDHTVRIWDATPLTSDPQAAHCVTLTGHQQQVSGVAFSRDGRWLASASFDHTVKVWETGKTDLQSVPNSPDGLQIRPTTLTLRYTLRGHRGNVIAVAFSPDNRTLASAGWDNTVKLWDLAAPEGDSLAELRTIPCPQRISTIGFSRDGQLLAIGLASGIAFHDPATGNEVHPFQRTPAGVPGLAFSPDGRRLVSAGASDPAVKVWDVAGEKLDFEIRHNSNPNATVDVSPDGQFIASSARDHAADDPAVKIWKVDWDAKTYTPFRTFKGQGGFVWKVAFSPDGRYLASGCWDSTVKVWDLRAPAAAEPVVLRGHAGFIRSLAFSPDGRRLASASGYAGHGEIKVWDASLWENKAAGGR